MQNNIKQALNLRGMEHNDTTDEHNNMQNNIKQALNARQMQHNNTTDEHNICRIISNKL